MKKEVEEIADRQKHAGTISQELEHEDKVEVFKGKYVEVIFIVNKKRKTTRYSYSETDFSQKIESKLARKIIKNMVYVGKGRFNDIYEIYIGDKSVDEDWEIMTIYAYPPNCQVKEFN